MTDYYIHARPVPAFKIPTSLALQQLTIAPFHANLHSFHFKATPSYLAVGEQVYRGAVEFIPQELHLQYRKASKATPPQNPSSGIYAQRSWGIPCTMRSSQINMPYRQLSSEIPL